jgi:hypothetical protein
VADLDLDVNWEDKNQAFMAVVWGRFDFGLLEAHQCIWDGTPGYLELPTTNMGRCEASMKN